uniref:Uncharacterized protein n=1 Tax=Arundo donax TaxID=35708 RepID=A0A0A8XPE7_ARUDO
MTSHHYFPFCRGEKDKSFMLRLKKQEAMVAKQLRIQHNSLNEETITPIRDRADFLTYINLHA